MISRLTCGTLATELGEIDDGHLVDADDRVRVAQAAGARPAGRDGTRATPSPSGSSIGSTDPMSTWRHDHRGVIGRRRA